VTLNDEQYDFVQSEMKKQGITKYSMYFQKIIDERIRREEQGIAHILANSRETNKFVRIILEMLDYQLKDTEHFIPTSVSKSAVRKDADLAVSEDLRRLREIKLSKKSNIE